MASVSRFLYIIDVFMCLWLLFVVFKYIIIDWFICFRWYSNLRIISVSLQELTLLLHSEPYLIGIFIFRNNGQISLYTFTWFAAEFICIYITWFVCNTLFMVGIACFPIHNNRFIYLFALVLLYLSKKLPFYFLS